MPFSKWKTFGCSVRGASHVRKDKDNQDSLHTSQGMTTSGGYKATPSIIAVSDGHGGDKYVRSAKGSNIAVATVAQVARDYLDLPLSSALSRTDLEDKIRHIKFRYLLSWQKAVDEQIKLFPLNESELEFLKENCKTEIYDAVINNPRLTYGCTLLCAIAYHDLLLVLQLGDGDILGLYPDDQVRDLTISNSKNFANETMSLCSTTDASDISHLILIGEDIPQLLTLTTDGVVNSFADVHDFHKIPVIIKNGLTENKNETAKVIESATKFLEKVTSEGAGDDVTLGVVFDTEFRKE